MQAAVLSDGAWGTALALTLIDNGHSVTQWGPFPDYICEMRSSRNNSRFMPGIPLPESLKLRADMEETVKDAELIVLASPTQYCRGTLEKLSPFYNSEKHILVNVAKGIENHSLKRISEICSEVLPVCLAKISYSCFLMSCINSREISISLEVPCAWPDG